MSSPGPDAKTIYLAGPTAVGKSDLAVVLAERLNGEIIGADAFQVYRGLNILTAKPSTATLARVRHHLIGEIPLTDSFDVASYRARAVERIAEVIERGKTPIVVGGTGLYLRALTHGLADLPPPDEGLRAKLSAEPLDRLLGRLEELDPVTAQVIDRQNPRRIIRALEVCLLTGRPFSGFREQWALTPNLRAVFLSRDREELYARIDRRSRSMFAHGVVEEVRAVGEISATAAQAIGFREIRDLLAGRISEGQCIASLQQQTRNYAKRQLTWFRRETQYNLVELKPGETDEAAIEQVMSGFGNF